MFDFLSIGFIVCFWIRIEAFRPLWLAITDEISGFKFLTDTFNSNEKTPQYCDAVSRALDIPTCKVVPFFGTFLKDLRTILSNVPSIVVLCNRNTQKPIEVNLWKMFGFGSMPSLFVFQTVADMKNEEHFLTRKTLLSKFDCFEFDELFLQVLALVDWSIHERSSLFTWF